jgi:predicted RNA-binding protein YlxR (DUF448 family)
VGPRRRCVACGRSLPKDELLRLVRSPAGELTPDPEALAAGRGAYLCRRPKCRDKAPESRAFFRSFHAHLNVPDETLDFIREWQRSASTK